LYYEAESDLANAMRPSWDEQTYRHVDVIAADRVFADINDAVVNAETRSISVTQRGLYFAFYDQVYAYHTPLHYSNMPDDCQCTASKRVFNE